MKEPDDWISKVGKFEYGLEITCATWMPVAMWPPDQNGWYVCLSLSGKRAVRLWEDGAWWKFSYIEAEHDVSDAGWSLVPNNSISHWANVSPPKITRMVAAGSA